MGQDVFVLNPFGQHAQAPWRLSRHRFNPLAHLKIDSPNLTAEARALAQALIVTEGRDPYFDDTARDLVMAIMLYLVAALGAKASLPLLRKAVTVIAARGKEGEMLLKEMQSSPYPFIAQPIGRFMDDEARDISSAINTAITQTAFLDDPAFSGAASGGTLTGSDFDLAQLKRKPTTVYLMLPGRFMDSYARFLRTLITAAIDRVTAEPGGYPVLMLLDEAARLQNLPALISASGFAAGFNFQLWSHWQNIGQLQAVYGGDWRTILANCGMEQFFTPTDIETADYIQRRGGTMTGESRSYTYKGAFFRRGQSESRSETRMPLLPVERVMGLPSDQSVVFFAGTHHPLLASRRPYWTIPRLSGLYDPDPYHLT
jgi:type IV secretion system protein VirD4